MKPILKSMKVKFVAVAALGKNREIGLDGKLPWNLPDEYAHFKEIVKDQHVLIGRVNFDLHGGDVAGSKPLVLSKSDPRYFSDMNQIIDYAESNKIEVIYVIGGAKIYELTLPYISEFYCSVVDYAGPADQYFPEYLYYEWEVLKTEIHDKWSLYHFKKYPNF